MDNSISYSEFEVLLTELNKRLEDYYGEGSFMGFKIRIESFLANFKSEYFKNIASLNKDNKASYIAHLNNKIERFKEVFGSGDKRYLEILAKFKIDEKNLFNHTQTSNELYRILCAELSTLKGIYKDANPDDKDAVSYDEVVDILRIFYKQYSNEFTDAVYSFVNNLPSSIGSEQKPVTTEVRKNANSFGFPKDSENKLKKIYYELKLDSGDFVSKLKTSYDDFVNLLRAKDYSDVEAEIHFECETTQAAYIITAMQKFSKSFTFKKISNSRKFFSDGGVVISDTNLSKSKSTTPRPKQADDIDRFFAELVLIQ